jgi:hypothetical protein
MLALVAAALVAVVVVVVGPAVRLVAGVGADCAAAADGPSAAVVVDFGDVAGEGTPPADVVARCVPVDGGTNGGDALKAAGFTLRVQGGLVCAIDGYPAEGCGKRTGQRQYKYWSYWRADATGGAWTYASIGPAGARVQDGDLEGWRFVDGSGSPNDPQPRRAPDHLAICGPASSPPSAPPGPSPSDALAASPVPGATSGADGAGPSAPSPGVDDTTAGSLEPSAGTSAVTGDAEGEGNVDPTDDAALAFDEAASTDRGSTSGGLVGAFVVGVMVVALGLGAFFRSRRAR